MDCHEGIKKRERRRNEGSLTLWVLFFLFFLKRVGWLERRVTVNGKKWTRFTGGCDRERLFLTRRQSQSELQIHHFSEAARRRGGETFKDIQRGRESVKGREEEGERGIWVWLTALHLIWAARSFFIWLPLNQLRGCGGLGGEGLPGCLRLALMCHVTL